MNLTVFEMGGEVFVCVSHNLLKYLLLYWVHHSKLFKFESHVEGQKAKYTKFSSSDVILNRQLYHLKINDVDFL